MTIIAFFTELAILGNLLSLSSLFIFFLLVVGILVVDITTFLE